VEPPRVKFINYLAQLFSQIMVVLRFFFFIAKVEVMSSVLRFIR